jgi:hypothetical protein
MSWTQQRTGMDAKRNSEEILDREVGKIEETFRNLVCMKGNQ